MQIADQYERYMLTLINQERAKVGAAPLKLEQNLNVAAEEHSEWMLRRDIFSHTGASGSSPTQRMTKAGFELSGSWRTAENIAVQSERGSSGIRDDTADLHTSLMNSPGHRANILNPDLKYIGIGIELGDFRFDTREYESVIVTQNFASTQGRVDLDIGSITMPDVVAPTPTPTPNPEQPAPEPEPSDVVNGTNKSDRLKGDDGDNQIIGRNGHDRLWGRDGEDNLSGGSGKDTLVGGDGDDTLSGGRSNDFLKGGNDDDLLLGGHGNDRMIAGNGDDTLDGGTGADYMVGGRGADKFVFSEGNDKDYIRDFRDDQDMLDLSDFNFRNIDQALSLASQSRKDLVFDFGSGDVLTIKHTTLSEITDDLMI